MRKRRNKEKKKKKKKKKGGFWKRGERGRDGGSKGIGEACTVGKV